ncbi:hypothetical protein DINM_003695 [Dirofilaria immitis]|nr:hypothetical protein [Dirofilaria immitis]
MYFGPELACLEWLMECGSTEVIMSDGTSITCRADMRRYISDFGFDFRSIPISTIPFKWSPVLPTISMKKLDAIYEMRWAKKPKIYIVKVDATDSAIGDTGFQYFKECRQIEVLKLNFCDFFTDKAIEYLVSGRPSRTLRNIEIVANPYISDNFIKGIKRIRGLERAHFYFLPCVSYQAIALQSLKSSLPSCRTSFPEIKEVGYGYDHTVKDSNISKKGTKISSSLLRLEDQSHSILLQDTSSSQYHHSGHVITSENSDAAISTLIVHSTIDGLHGDDHNSDNDNDDEYSDDDDDDNII